MLANEVAETLGPNERPRLVDDVHDFGQESSKEQLVSKSSNAPGHSESERRDAVFITNKSDEARLLDATGSRAPMPRVACPPRAFSTLRSHRPAGSATRKALKRCLRA